MKTLLISLLLFGVAFGNSSVDFVDWYFSNGSTCSSVAADSCTYCSGYYYAPYTCYDLDDCTGALFFDSECTDMYYTIGGVMGDCSDNYNYTCTFFYSPPEFNYCDGGCTLPVLEVQSDYGISAYHLPYEDGPALLMQDSDNSVSVAGRFHAHYFVDGYGHKMFFEGFLTKNMYLTTAGYCNVGEWCNSTTVNGLQYKVDIQDINVNSDDSTFLGFHTYAPASFESNDYSDASIFVALAPGSHVNYLQVDSDWNLEPFSVHTQLGGSISGLLPIILRGSHSLPSGAVYSDMYFAPRSTSGGVLAYDFEVASFNIYMMTYCEQGGYSSSIPVCYLEGVSFDDVAMGGMVKKPQSSDEMAFSLL